MKQKHYNFLASGLLFLALFFNIKEVVKVESTSCRIVVLDGNEIVWPNLRKPICFSVCFFGIYILLPNLGNWMFGACVYHVLLIVLNGKLCLHTKLWNGLFFASLIATIVFYYLVSTIYNVHYWLVFN